MNCGFMDLLCHLIGDGMNVICTSCFKKLTRVTSYILRVTEDLKSNIIEAIPEFYVYVKRITLFNCLCYSSPSSNFSASRIRNIREFGVKKYFADHQTANTIQLFVIQKGQVFVFCRLINKILFEWFLLMRK